MKNHNPLLMTDVYKLGHESFYPENISHIYSYLTTRSDKKYKRVVFAGLQAVIKKNLSSPPTYEMVEEFLEYHQEILGFKPSDRMISKLYQLVRLGYWPLKIQAVREGSCLPHRQCLMTIENTHQDYAWLVGFMESMFLKVWNISTVATNSRRYRNLIEKYADLTCDNHAHVDYACHDFGYRGTSSEETAELSGLGHLISFKGTDTIPAIWAAKKLYPESAMLMASKTVIGCSLPATEHSTMSTNILMVQRILEDGGSYLDHSLDSVYKLTMDGDIVTDLEHFNNDTRLYAEALVFLNIITNLYPKGMVSIVSDTYDYFGVLSKVAPWLKEAIIKRDGKVIFRPDSGNPKDIIMQSLPILADTFGTTTNSKGYRVLNPKVGLIYGDGMYYDRFVDILKTMTKEVWATSNLVIGVGGLLLQQHSRDDLGFAIKATYAKVDGQQIEVYKDPKTDQKKKSHKGFMTIDKDESGEYVTVDQQAYKPKADIEGELRTVYLDGMVRHTTFEDIRFRLASENTEI